MIKLTEEQISDIAQELEIGMQCFVNKETGELKSIPDELREEAISDDELWQDEINEIENNIEKYIVINVMDSHDSYIVMEKFIDTVEDKQFAKRLTNAINVSKPFHNFRYELDQSGEYLNKWYAFKSQQMIEWVKKQLMIKTEHDLNDEETEDD